VNIDLVTKSDGAEVVRLWLDPNEADSLAAVLHEHVIKGEMYAGHSGPIRRSYPYLTELAQAICNLRQPVTLGGPF
jgi:hypothetical protein